MIILVEYAIIFIVLAVILFIAKSICERICSDGG